MTDRLAELREKIDQLDDDILQLLCTRLSLSADIISAKQGQNAFRPGREAQVIRRLTALAPQMAPDTLLGIWRHIFSASIAQQDGSLLVAVHCRALAAAVWHFGSAITARECDDVTTVMQAMDDGAALAIVPCDDRPDLLAQILYACDDRFIIARTPLFEIDVVPSSYIIGRQMPDPSGADKSIFAISGDTGANLIYVDGEIKNPQDAGLDRDARLVGMIAR